MNVRGWRASAAAVLIGASVACGGGSSSPPLQKATASVAAAHAGSGLTLSDYGAARTPVAAPTLAAAVALQATLALALPPLQDAVVSPSGPQLVAAEAVVFPAIQAARLELLGAAAAGDTLAELQAALPAGVTLGDMPALREGVSRTLWAPASVRFSSAFLAATDSGSSGGTSWRANSVADWLELLPAVAGFGSLGDLKLQARTRLLVGHQHPVASSFAGPVSTFTGVGLRSPDVWYTAPMLAFEGAGGTVQGDDHVAVATWVGSHLWVAIRPRDSGPLFRGLPPASLSRALQAAWASYPAPEGVASSSRQVWPMLTRELPDRSRLPTGIALPYNETQANLSGLGGGGAFLTESARAATLRIDSSGLQASGAQAMAFTDSEANVHGGGSSGSGSTLVNPLVPAAPPACPSSQADWQGAYLAIIERSGRLLLIAALPSGPEGASVCRRP